MSSRMWTFGVEPYGELVLDPDFAGMVARHLEEIYPGEAEGYDHGRYVLLDKAKILHVIVARVDGKLAGYASYIVNTALHRKHIRVAVNDAYHLARERRRGMAALHMLRVAEAHLASIGVQIIYHASLLKNPVGILFERAGYRPVQVTWERRVREPAGKRTGGDTSRRGARPDTWQPDSADGTIVSNR